MKKSFIWQIMAAFILAILVGLLFGEKATYVEPLGNLFLRLIKFIIIPLILATIIVGVTSSGNMKKNLADLVGKPLHFILSPVLLRYPLESYLGLYFHREVVLIFK